ncbi:hypothetical protein LSAT2_001802, partial [Lamellibrachia satsuma]
RHHPAPDIWGQEDITQHQIYGYRKTSFSTRHMGTRR